MASVALPGTASAQTLFDYFLPVAHQQRTCFELLGRAERAPTRPRQRVGGQANQSCSYWDGRFLKAPDGKHHLFASRWDESAGRRGGWPGSDCVHAVSESWPLGPFVDQGPFDSLGS